MNPINNQANSYHPLDMSNPRQNPSSVGTIDKVNVSNGTITWPENGWYEVQFAGSHNTVSEGGQSASPGPGVYNVINHTTGERFEGVVVSAESTAPIAFSGRSRTSAEELRDSPTASERLGGDRNSFHATSDADSSRSNASPIERASSETSVGDDSEVVDTQTIRTETTYPDTTPEDFRSDQRTTVGGAAVVSLGVAAVSGPVGWGTLGGVALGAAGAGGIFGIVSSETVVTTTTIGSDGTVTRTETGDPRLNGNDPLSSTTTSITNFDSGRQVITVTDHLTGDQRTIDSNQNGVTTVTRSENDTSSTNSPRTNTTVDEDGVTTTTVTSPTGGTFGPAGTNNVPEPAEPAPTTQSDTQVGVSSADSAEAGNFGTNSEGEFGGTSQPAVEPVSQPASTTPARDPNRNSDSDTDNSSGGGGVSSSQSAENGGFGSSAGGEFG